MEFKIEKGVPLPKPRLKGAVAALRQLEVGDSVIFPTRGSKITGTVKALKPMKFTQRKCEGGCRVWRIE